MREKEVGEGGGDDLSSSGIHSFSSRLELLRAQQLVFISSSVFPWWVGLAKWFKLYFYLFSNILKIL